MKCVKCGYEIYEGDVCPLCGCKTAQQIVAAHRAQAQKQAILKRVTRGSLPLIRLKFLLKAAIQ